MDGTMVDSMPFHQESWLLFAKRYAIEIDMPDLMARTTGRTGSECMEILFGQCIGEPSFVARKGIALPRYVCAAISAS
jgi:beta-phosphoglucomutase-like phosphatase (HAD superfamily)